MEMQRIDYNLPESTKRLFDLRFLTGQPPRGLSYGAAFLAVFLCLRSCARCRHGPPGVGLFVMAGTLVLAITLVWVKGKQIRAQMRKYGASEGFSKCLKQESPRTLTWLPSETRFTFDHVAGEAISQLGLQWSRWISSLCSFRPRGVSSFNTFVAEYDSDSDSNSEYGYESGIEDSDGTAPPSPSTSECSHLSRSGSSGRHRRRN